MDAEAHHFRLAASAPTQEAAPAPAVPAGSPPGPEARRPSPALRLRPLLVRLHRWMSFALMVPLLVLAATGVVLQYEGRLNSWLRPELYRSSGGDVGPDAALSAALARYQAAGTKAAAGSLVLPGDNRGVYRVDIDIDVAAPDGDGDHEHAEWVYVDPGTADVNGVRDPDEGFTHWMRRGHAAFWQDGGFLSLDGPHVVAGVAIGSILTLLAGLYLWYRPRVRPWAQRLRVRRRRGWFVFNLDLHKTTGALTVVPLVVIAFTGAAIAFPPMKTLYERLSPARAGAEQWDAPEAATESSDGDGRTPLTAAAVTALIRERFPDATIEALEPPVEERRLIDQSLAFEPVWGAWLTVGFSPWNNDGGSGNTYLQIDRYSGAILYAGTPEDGNVADQLWNDWSSGLHSGEFAGATSRFAWMLTAAATWVLAAGGCAMWLSRRRRAR